MDIQKLGVRDDELMAYISRANLSVIPIHGAFRYDIARDASSIDHNLKAILGVESNVVSFAQVLQAVDPISKTLFQEQSIGQIGKHDCFHTNEFQLKNGNIVKEFYKFDYHPDDYDKRSPTHISGQTTLLSKVA